MIVDADSWHMRRCRSYYGWHYEPANLCRHFWKTILAIVWPGFTILLRLFMIGMAILLAWLVFKNPWLLIGVGIGAGVGTATWMVSIFLQAHQKTYSKARHSKEKAPGLFSSWLKAKKGRYCPLIEVRGGEGRRGRYPKNMVTLNQREQ